MYDLFVDELGQKSEAEFSIELFELKDNDWVLASESKDPYKKSKATNLIHEFENEKFNTHNYIFELNKWRGKFVRIDLVSKAPKYAETIQKGRWIRTKIIAMNFEIVLGSPIDSENNLQTSSQTYTPKSDPLPYPSTGNAGNVSVTDLGDYPDGGMAIATYGNSLVGYFHTKHTPTQATGTTFFVTNSPDNFYNISVSNLVNQVARDANNVPFFPLSQSLTDKTAWNHYQCITTAFTAYVPGVGTRVHAFTHAEDHSQDATNWNEDRIDFQGPVYRKNYVRIAYARALNPVVPFQIIPSSSQTNPPVVIESFQTENGIDFTEDANGSFGVGSPSVIEKDGYIYMFYSRWYSWNALSSQIYPTLTKLGSVAHSICVARAPLNDVLSSSHTSNQNPWHKYYNGTWDTQPGLGGLSSGIIPKVEDDYTSGLSGDYRSFPKVFKYDQYSNCYMVICTGGPGIMLHVNKNSSMSDWSEGVTVLTPSQAGYAQVLYPSIADNGSQYGQGSDAYFLNNGMLYYAVDNDLSGGGHWMQRRTLNIAYP